MIRNGIAVLSVCVVLVVEMANAAARSNTTRIQVMASESHSVTTDNNGVPKNCDSLNFDAYCHNSKTVEVINTMLVREGNDPPFRLACKVESKWSRCIRLAEGQSFEAKRDNRGLTVYYLDGKGKLRSQLYTVVGEEKGDAAKAAGPTAATAESETAIPAAGNAAPPAAQTGGVVEGARPSSARQTVKCSFTSTPAGAEVTVDGRYVGSTPSVIGLTTGTHVVVVSMGGFTQWKRELSVEAGSELTVSAVLEKAQ